MRILVLGGSGMLGRAVVAEARRRGHAALGLSRPQADLRDRERLGFWTRRFSPRLIVNCAAFTAVDRCEEDREAALEVNGSAVGTVVAAAAEAGADTVNVGSLAPATGGNVNGIGAVLTINGEGEADSLNVDDTADTLGNTGTLRRLN